MELPQALYVCTNHNMTVLMEPDSSLDRVKKEAQKYTFETGNPAYVYRLGKSVPLPLPRNIQDRGTDETHFIFIDIVESKSDDDLPIFSKPSKPTKLKQKPAPAKPATSAKGKSAVQKLTALDVATAIQRGDCTLNQVRELLFTLQRSSMQVGSRVSFTAKGRLFTGTVVKINPKTVKVKTDGSSITWTCHPNTLALL